jgi:hypothetical protein
MCLPIRDICAYVYSSALITNPLQTKINPKVVESFISPCTVSPFCLGYENVSFNVVQSEKITDCSSDHMKHINALCVLNVNFYDVKVCGTQGIVAL